jgi:ABC-type multidrug transport system fused ATPase/permease subunit
MDERPEVAPEATGELLRRLAADLTALVRLYGRAVREHVSGMARDLATAALLIGAALILGVLALGLAVALVVLVVALWLPAWLATLVVLASIVIAMAALVLVGTRRVRRRRAAWAARMAEEIRWLRSLFVSEN